MTKYFLVRWGRSPSCPKGFLSGIWAKDKDAALYEAQIRYGMDAVIED